MHHLIGSIYLITARKRSLGQGNMFTGVCLSTGRQGWGVSSQWGLLPGGGGAWSGGVHGPRGCMVPGVCAWSRGWVLGCQGVVGVHGPGGGAWSQGGARWRPPNGYCCGRYASYWNAFLFDKSLSN